jgi:hypothetical protein
MIRSISRIAAANALSDIYAMGPARCRPEPDCVSRDLLGSGLSRDARRRRGGRGGGHRGGGKYTVDDAEPKYGMCGSGRCGRMRWCNRGARPTTCWSSPSHWHRVITTAFLRAAPPGAVAGLPSPAWPSQPSAALPCRERRACATDITGFGCSATWLRSSVPAAQQRDPRPATPLPGARELADQGLPGGRYVRATSPAGSEPDADGAACCRVRCPDQAACSVVPADRARSS